MDFSFLQNLVGQKQAPTVVPGGSQTPIGGIPLANITPATQDTQPAQPVGSGFSWLDNLRSNPDMKQAMLIAGLNMMMTQPGESALGSVGRGALAGLDYYSRKKKSDEAQSMQNRKDEMKLAQEAEQLKTAQLTNAELPNVQAAAAETTRLDQETKRLSNDKAQKTLGDLLRKAKAEADKADDEAQASKIQLAVEQRLEKLRQQHPEWEESIQSAKVEAAKLAPKKVRADITQSEAAAYNSTISAKAKKAELDAFNQLTPEEKKQLQMRNTTGGSSSAMEQNIAGIMQAWDTLNDKPADAPGQLKWRKERAAYELSMRNKITTQAKVNRVQALKTVIETSEDPAAVAAAQQELSLLTQEEQAAAAAPHNVSVAPPVIPSRSWDPRKGVMTNAQ